MYWVVHAAALFAESWTQWILKWIPFYAWIRLFFHLYLVLPQTQGARVLYATYVEPWLARHESDIDALAATLHARLRVAGGAFLSDAIDWLCVHVLHITSSSGEREGGEGHDGRNGKFGSRVASHAGSYPPLTTGPAQPQNYMSSLLARFAIPSQRTGASPGAAPANSEFYTMLAQAAGAAIKVSGGALATSFTSSSTASTAIPGGRTTAMPATFPDESPSGGKDSSGDSVLIPPGLRQAAPSEQLSFLAAQRERLLVLLGAMDRETAHLSGNSSTAKTTPLGNVGGRSSSSSQLFVSSSRSRSETDFEQIEAESGTEDISAGVATGGGGGGAAGAGGGGDSTATKLRRRRSNKNKSAKDEGKTDRDSLDAGCSTTNTTSPLRSSGSYWNPWSWGGSSGSSGKIDSTNPSGTAAVMSTPNSASD